LVWSDLELAPKHTDEEYDDVWARLNSCQLEWARLNKTALQYEARIIELEEEVLEQQHRLSVCCLCGKKLEEDAEVRK